MNLLLQKHRAKSLTPKERDELVRKWEEGAGDDDDKGADICHAHADRQCDLPDYSRH